MEHLSRRTTHKVNLLVIVSDPTMKGILTAKRIHALVDELKLEIDKIVLIINRVTGDSALDLKRIAETAGITVAGLVPQDEMIAQFDLQGKPVFELPEDASSVKTLFSILDACRIP
jgi:CO dehydrogenase maturation factor